VLDLRAPQPQRRGMAGVDDRPRRTGEVDPQEKAGNELARVCPILCVGVV
jgi:hypothetical protein